MGRMSPIRIPRAVRRWCAPLLLTAVIGLIAGSAEAQLDQMLKGLSGGGAGAGMSDDKHGRGLKEAAQAATETHVRRYSVGGAVAALSDAKIGAGRKEALQVATEKTVSLTGKTDGYFTNQAIKI